MSEENVERMRRWLEALSNEDFDAALALVHPDVEFVPPGGQPPARPTQSCHPRDSRGGQKGATTVRNRYRDSNPGLPLSAPPLPLIEASIEGWR